MVTTLTRVFPVSSPACDFMALASLPLLAPRYLNFLTRIVPVTAEVAPDCAGAYKVWVHYRSVIQLQGSIHHEADVINRLIKVRHDGPLVMFDAVFAVHEAQVRLDCTYLAKVPMGDWLISKVLDKTLGQVALAMDRYAATRAWGPQ